MSQNEPKPAKTSRNQPKRPKVNRNDPQKIAKRPETTQNCKIGEIFNLLLAFDFQILSLILTKFRMYPNLNVLISNLPFVFESFEPKCPNLGILGQKVLAL